MSDDNSDVSANGTVAATIVQNEHGKWIWIVVHLDNDGTPELIGENYANVEEAKSAAWHAAQRLGAATTSTKRRVK